MSVVKLANGTIPYEPNPNVIQMLKNALARAESGEVTGIAIVEADPTGFDTHYVAQPGVRHSLAAGVLSLGWLIGREVSLD